MAKIIAKFGYLKGGSRGGYTKYIATREGVEKLNESLRDLPVTQNQQEFIQKLLMDFPDSKDLLEYEDYQKSPTLGSASEFISAALELHMGELSGRSGYLKYMGTRPRVEKQGSHGLFSYAGCKNRHPSPICTRFEHHFHALKPHLHRRSFSDTLPENQRHLIALKRHPLWHMQKLCQLSQPAELRSTFFRNRNAVLCQDVLQLSNPLALSLEFFLSCVKVFHRLTLHLVVAGPFQF